MRGYGSGTPGGTGPPPWFDVRFTFPDGARADVLAQARSGGVAVEELRAEPPLSPDGLAALAEPLAAVARATLGSADGTAAPAPPSRGRPRARFARRGRERRRAAAAAYLAARRGGTDPVLAVMAATGRGRRRSLRLISAARDAGLLPSRHRR